MFLWELAERISNLRLLVVLLPGGREITEADVNRVQEAAEAVSLPQNRFRLRTLPREFSVDDQRGLKIPLGFREFVSK